MALVESIKIPLGSSIPKFHLKDTNNQTYTHQSFQDANGLLVAFTCNHCPYAIAVWPRLIKLAEYARQFDIQTIAINPNIHPDYPEDSPKEMIKKIKEWNIDFPYLIDEKQEAAKSFKAQCTPDIYLFNKNQKLIYHGRIDDNWKNEENVMSEELKQAITDYGTNQPINPNQKPSMGCSIKWK